jgi:hypothetical protein
LFLILDQSFALGLLCCLYSSLATQKFIVVPSIRLISLKSCSAENIPDLPPPKRGLAIKFIQNAPGCQFVEVFLCGNLRQLTLEVKIELLSEESSHLREISSKRSNGFRSWTEYMDSRQYKKINRYPPCHMTQKFCQSPCRIQTRSQRRHEGRRRRRLTKALQPSSQGPSIPYPCLLVVA